jgi:hypothetical protein
MVAMRGTLFRHDWPPDPNVCRVCGHRTILPARQTVNRLLLVVIGILISYIALDVAHSGHFDGSLYRAIERGWHQQAGDKPRVARKRRRLAPITLAHASAAEGALKFFVVRERLLERVDPRALSHQRDVACHLSPSNRPVRAELLVRHLQVGHRARDDGVIERVVSHSARLLPHHRLTNQLTNRAL